MRFPDFNDEWQETTLGAIAEKKRKKNNDNAISKVYSNSAQLGIIEQTDFFDKEIANSNNLRGYYIVEYLDFIYNPRISSWAPVGAMNLNKQTELGIVSPLYTVFRIDQRILSPYFVGYLFKSSVWHTYMKQIANYGARDDRMNIKDSDFFALPVSLPSLAEQKKIADFFSLIDERIQSCSETIRELKNQKAALLNQLFSQKLRFPDFNDEWTQTTLGEIAERVTRKNNGHVTSRPLTISAQYGLIDQRDFFNKIVASTSLEGYYLLNKGEFAYNRSSSADYPWGAIKRLESYENGALSTLYICFSLLQGYPSFIAHFFETSQWHEYIQSIAAEGARNHGLLNISVSDFFTLPISLPSLEEQKKIADFLSLIDERIEVEEQLLKKYEEQKKYLLRNMFV